MPEVILDELQHLIVLLMRRSNYLVLPEIRDRGPDEVGRYRRHFCARIAAAAGCDVDTHHGSPVIVRDRAAFDAAKVGERMPDGAWDGIGNYLRDVTAIERDLLPPTWPYNLKRLPVVLDHDRGPQPMAGGDIMGGVASVDHGNRIAGISPARAFLLATLMALHEEGRRP